MSNSKTPFMYRLSSCEDLGQMSCCDQSSTFQTRRATANLKHWGESWPIGGLCTYLPDPGRSDLPNRDLKLRKEPLLWSKPAIVPVFVWDLFYCVKADLSRHLISRNARALRGAELVGVPHGLLYLNVGDDCWEHSHRWNKVWENVDPDSYPAVD